MSYIWVAEPLGNKQVNYRVPGRALVGTTWKGWHYVSLFDAAANRWVRQDGVYSDVDEAREWAELLLDEADIDAGAPAEVYRVTWTVEVPARSAAEAEALAKLLSRDAGTFAVETTELVG